MALIIQLQTPFISYSFVIIMSPVLQSFMKQQEPTPTPPGVWIKRETVVSSGPLPWRAWLAFFCVHFLQELKFSSKLLNLSCTLVHLAPVKTEHISILFVPLFQESQSSEMLPHRIEKEWRACVAVVDNSSPLWVTRKMPKLHRLVGCSWWVIAACGHTVNRYNKVSSQRPLSFDPGDQMKVKTFS